MAYRPRGVSCYSPTARVAVGYADTSVTSDGGLTWTTTQDVAPVYTLDAISCQAGGFCAALGTSGVGNLSDISTKLPQWR